MICERCKKSNVIKAGFVGADQRYKCKDCLIHFVKQYKRLNEDECLRVIRFCAYGMPMNAVAQMFCITTTTVARWVKWYKERPNDKELRHDDLDPVYVKLWMCSSKTLKRYLVLRFKLMQLESMVPNYENVKAKKVN